MDSQSSMYPAGHIKYAFEMHMASNEEISLEYGHTNVTKLVLKKENPSDEYDPKWLMTIHFGPVSSIEEVDETGNEIKDDIFNILSFALNTKIVKINRVGHGLTPRPGEGAICHGFLPVPGGEIKMKVGCPNLSNSDIQEVQDYILRSNSSQHQTFNRLYSYAIGTDEPVVQFLILYLILYEINRNQAAIDRQIMALEPNTPQSISTHTRQPETIYTRLRNEITHRINSDPETTRVEIINNQDNFKKIVHDTLKQMV